MAPRATGAPRSRERHATPERTPTRSQRAFTKPDRVGAPSRCELLAIGTAARARYERAFAAFSQWFDREGGRSVATPSSLEESLLDFTGVLCDRGCPANDAELHLAAARYALPLVATGWPFARMKKALAGFRKARPPRSRPPIPHEVMCGLVEALVFRRKEEMALMVMLMYASYCRPGEIRTLEVRQVLRPSRRAGPLSVWAISIALHKDEATFAQRPLKNGDDGRHGVVGPALVPRPDVGAAHGGIAAAREGLPPLLRRQRRPVQTGGVRHRPPRLGNVPASPRRGLGGRAGVQAAHGRGLRARKVEKRHLPPPLCEAINASSAVVAADSRGAELLQDGRQPHRRHPVAAPDCEAPAASERVVTLGRCHPVKSGLAPALVMLDLMAGTRRMAAALQRMGIQAHSFEVADDHTEDVMLAANSRWIHEQVKTHKALLVWAALLGSTWSRARRNTSGKRGWPAPLRATGDHL